MLFALMAFAVLINPSAMGSTIAPAHQPQALILSSIQKQYPMEYVSKITAELKQVGYNVTFLSGSAITLSFVATQLNRYDILIWRTDTYYYGNNTYWYLGQQSNETTYAGSMGLRTIDVANGMVAVTAEFFNQTYGPNTLSHVKLAILMSSDSITIAQTLIAAGVKATNDLYKELTAPPNLYDWVTQSLVAYLTTGTLVKDAVYKTIYNYEYVSSLDDSYLPPVSYLGDGNLTLG